MRTFYKVNDFENSISFLTLSICWRSCNNYAKLIEAVSVSLEIEFI